WIGRAVGCCRRREALRRYCRRRADDCRGADSQAAAEKSKGDELRQTIIWEVPMTAGKWLKTACDLCYVNCGIEVWVNEGRLEKVRGDRSSPKSQGYLCNKATRIPYYAHHRDR